MKKAGFICHKNPVSGLYCSVFKVIILKKCLCVIFIKQAKVIKNRSFGDYAGKDAFIKAFFIFLCILEIIFKIVDIRFFICSIIMRINMSWRDKGSFFNLKYLFTSFKPRRIKQYIIIQKAYIFPLCQLNSLIVTGRKTFIFII